MRFYEIQSLPTPKPIKPVKPLSPEKARIKSIQNKIESDRNTLQQERERQRKQIEVERNKRLHNPSVPPVKGAISR